MFGIITQSLRKAQPNTGITGIASQVSIGNGVCRYHNSVQLRAGTDILNELKKERFSPHSADLMLGDNISILTYKLSRENKDALNILNSMLKWAIRIDPSMENIKYLFMFDDLGIYGQDIVKLSSACGDYMLILVTLLRSYQLEMLHKEQIYTLIELRDKNYLEEIKKVIPNFNPEKLPHNIRGWENM